MEKVKIGMSCLLILLSAYAGWNLFKPNHYNATMNVGNTVNDTDIEYIHGSFVTDVSNDRKLVGLSTNVFIGKVIKKIGDQNIKGYPESQYKVKVLNNIKGNLEGEVTVNQLGGFEDGKLNLFIGDQLIKPENNYLFVTLFDKKENWYTLVPIYGNIQIKDSAIKSSLIKRFVNAHKNEIKFKKVKDNVH